MKPSGSNPGAERRRAAEAGGRRAETLAALFLRLKGYRVLMVRAKTPVGEIDIVARRGKTIVFIEVKQRRSADRQWHALESVNVARIQRAAQFLLMKNRAWQGADLRFDVIFLAPRRWPRHLINAF